MFSMISKLSSTALNIAHGSVNRLVQVSCALLFTASRVSAYAQALLPNYSQEFWEIGQGALMTACGIATIVKARKSTGSRKWRYPAVAGGACMVGVGVYSIVTNVGRMCVKVPNEFLFERRVVSLDLSAELFEISHKPICLRSESPPLFEQTCSLQNHKNIFVMCHVANGNGDVAHCKKVFEFLEEAFPAHRVEIGYPEIVRNSLRRYFSQEFCNQVTFLSNYSDLSNRKADVIVDCPMAANSIEIEEIMETILNGTTPHVGIAEFDYASAMHTMEGVMERQQHFQSTFLSAGLGKNSIGIPFNPLRYKASQATSFNDLERLKNLASITSKPLQEAILGQPYSEAAIVKFNQRHALYPSYTHSSVGKDAFFSTILKLSNLLNDTREPCFVFVGRPLSPFTRPPAIPMEERRIVLEMQHLGFHSIDYIVRSRMVPFNMDRFESEHFQFGGNWGTGRSIRIIQTPYTSHQNLMTLFSAGRIGQATGDQTPVEMLETHTPFVYELLHHKADFAGATRDLAFALDPEFGLAVHDLMTRFDERHTDFAWRTHTFQKYGQREESWPDHSTTRVAESLKFLMEKPVIWNRFIKLLFENHNEFTFIREVVQKYLK